MSSPSVEAPVQFNAPAAGAVDGWGAALGVRRRRGWEDELARWAWRRLKAPFAWGVTDCALLAVEAVDVQLGTAIAARHAGRYHSLLGAMRYQLAAGVDLARELEAAGCAGIAPVDARFGDILVAARGPFMCGHVCFGRRCLSAPIDGVVRWSQTYEVIDQPAMTAFTVEKPHA